MAGELPGTTGRARTDPFLGAGALTDPITRGPGAGFFLEALEHELRRQHRHREPFSLVLLRLQGYEALCERDGQAAGQTLQWEAARLIRDELRDSDLFARLQEGEFALLLINTPAQWAEDVARRLRVRLGERPFTLPGRTLQIRVSGGYTAWREGDSGGELLERVQEALAASESADGQIIARL